MSRFDYTVLLQFEFSKDFTCPSGKLRTKFISPIAKCCSPRLLDSVFFAHCNVFFSCICFFRRRRCTCKQFLNQFKAANLNLDWLSHPSHTCLRHEKQLSSGINLDAKLTKQKKFYGYFIVMRCTFSPFEFSLAEIMIRIWINSACIN